MHRRVRTLAIAIPLAALPLARIDHVAPAPRAPRAPNGYVVTMQFDDRSSFSRFTIKVLDGRFRVELDDVLPMVGRVMSAGSDWADAMSMLAIAGPAAAGAYMFAGDSGELVVVLPTANMAAAFAPAAPAGVKQALAGEKQGKRDKANARADKVVGRRPGKGGQSGPGSSAVESVTVKNLGVGEKMLGRATRKYRIRVSSPLSAGGSCANATSNAVTTDGWFATDLSDGGFMSVFSLLPLLLGGASPAGGLDPLQIALPRGLPMKLVSVCDTPSREPAGTLTVTSIESKTIDAADFGIPAGMQIVDPGAVGRVRTKRGGG